VRWVVGVFAGIGVFVSLYAPFMLILLFTDVPLAVRSKDYIFNISGLDPQKPYKVVWDRSEPQSRDGPYDVICIHLLEGGFSPERPEDWSWRADDPWEARIRRDVLPYEDWLNCIPEEELMSTSTGFYLRGVRYHGQRVSNATVFFYHPPTQRLLFLDWST
jgi:hypothetical protein